MEISEVFESQNISMLRPLTLHCVLPAIKAYTNRASHQLTDTAIYNGTCSVASFLFE
ncbi:hypothetical protein [Stutzerimonas stutzeri]|uniref:hypothetical protein n=1 Tax=Stutzerimonas stutzeri TaxID=316 RepID=UPI0002E67E45|nr:hypothetical protein [Stutzerimonas stutzeri]